MNIVLFEAEETSRPLPRTDPRASHVLEVLRRQVGDLFDVGLIDGPRGKGTLSKITHTHLHLDFTWGELPAPFPSLTLFVGLSRPQTARKILQEVTTLGVAALHFINTERGEKSYATSTLWSSGEWRRHLVAGAAQAFCTRLPATTHGKDLADLLPNLPPDTIRIALDNYEAPNSLTTVLKDSTAKSVALAIGSERGWTAEERASLRENGFQFAHLGTRVLRTETAAVAAVAVTKSILGWF